MEPDRIGLYRKMLLCRRLEEAIARLWHEGRIPGEMHLGIGEEGINVGVLDHVGEGDAVALDHRSTAGMVLMGVDPAAIIKECLGRPDGLCAGMGGHMHLFSKEHLAASSGIVGASGPAACGFAMAAQYLRPGKVAVAFFGEGAMNQGMLLEAMNLAAVWKLPVLFVCRDNGVAITTSSASVTAGNLEERARSLGVSAAYLDGSDVEKVWREAGKMIERARGGGGPSFLRASCLRPEGHFLGDPMLRIVRRPVHEMRPRLGPLVLSILKPSGASLMQRRASLGKVTSTLLKALAMRSGSAYDPLRLLKQRLEDSKEALEALQQDIEKLVNEALKEALQPVTAGEKEA